MQILLLVLGGVIGGCLIIGGDEATKVARVSTIVLAALGFANAGLQSSVELAINTAFFVSVIIGATKAIAGRWF